MGQSKKRRACPAVSRDITSAECGENRLSRYACPEGCPFNPFAPDNYTALLQAEDELDLTSIKRIVGEDPTVTATIYEGRRLNEGHGWHAATAWQLFFKRDATRATFAERWQQAGFPGLKNDERVFFRGKMQLQVALLEIHRVLDSQRIEAVDLLAPAGAPMILVDRKVAARAARFDAILTWIYPLPHFWRISGTGITMSDLGPFSPLEMLDACMAHLGGPAGREEQRRWLAENFARIDDALVATGIERRRQMLAGLDASFGVATYELRSSFGQCRNALVEDPAIEIEAVEEDERENGFVEAMVWFDPEQAGGSVSALIPGRRVLGRVLLGRNEWQVQAIGGARLDHLRERFEARLGKRVRFAKERRDDIAGQMAAKGPAANLALVPPRLLERPTSLDLASSRIAAPPDGVSMEVFNATLMQEQLRVWFDEPLPALEGRTAREAARMPAWRGRLLELVKGQVRRLDQRNLETGRADDINALIRELGLTEIDFPPPPSRAPLKEDESFEDEVENEREVDRDAIPFPPQPSPAGTAAGWSAPLLGSRPLTVEEAMERLRAGLDAFETAADAMRELEATGASLLDDAQALAARQVDERDFGALVVFLIQVWFALVPRGGRVPLLRWEAMAAAIDRDGERLSSARRDGPAAWRRMLADSPQPHLLEVVAGSATELLEKGPKAMRPQPGSVIGMVLVLKTIIAEIDFALRRS